MAEANPAKDPAASGADQAAAGVEKLHLDEATGEMISKTELKKRQKTREREAKKHEKTAAKGGEASATAPKKSSAEADEKELSPHQVCLGLRS